MQASKIIPGKVYAITRGNTLMRFYVSEVNTITKRRSENRSPHDSRSEVVGRYQDGDDTQFVTVKPDDIEGEYSQYAELVERKAREDAERKAREHAEKEQAKADRLALYDFVGVTPPVDATKYDQLFRANFSQVTIGDKGVRALVERVKNSK